MPNWCQNILEITGEEADLEAFASKAEDSKFSLETYYPMPEEPGEHLDTEKPHWTDILSMGGEMPDWYNWRIKNWGTKWDISEEGGTFFSSEETELPVSSGTMTIEEGRISISFLTAWSPPEEGILNISKAYPSIAFALRYAEAGNNFAGSTTIQSGEILTQVESTFEEYAETYDFSAAY